MSGRQRLVYRPRATEFPEDFPQRLGRMRKSAGLTWRGLARALGVNVRTLYRWRAGARPDAAHMLALLEFAVAEDLLDVLMEREQEAKADSRQALLFDRDVWRRIGD